MEQIVQLRRNAHGSPVAASDIERDERRVDTETIDVQVDVERLAAELKRAVRGEVRFDRASRGLYATDGSNYRQPPIGVVVPRDEQDVVAAMEVANRYRVPVLGRGGGTSLAGQCCNTAIVIDFSKYMGRVKTIDPERRVAVVQPGCVLDDMREQAERHKLTWGPDPSTHNHCTMGGMIANNSCGVHAMMAEMYGPGPRTEHGIAELEILTHDGVRMRVGPTSDAELEAIIAEGGRRGRIYRDLRDLRDEYADDIREHFPDIPRRVSGYNLPALLPERGFDVAQALAGSESTLVMFLEATLKLMHHFPEQALLILGYPSIYDAGDHIRELRDLMPIGLEGIDDRLIHYMKKKGLHPADARHLPEGQGWLLCEFGGDTKDEAIDRARSAMSEIQGLDNAPVIKLITEDEVMKKVWEIRKSGLGATAFVPGEPDTWPGWEDAAVPPEKVGPYLREFRSLLDDYGYQCSLYGHLGQGCIHTRIDFRLDSAEGIEQYRRFTEAAADLVVGYGGSLSGEHGDGQSRGDLMPRMYPPRIMAALREFKRIWDPHNLMNPGKLIDANPRTENLRLGADYDPWHPQTYFAFPEDGGDFSHAALRCVGVGECRKIDEGTMCPSYMVTREEKHTTRGRARLLFEMVNKGDVITDRWDSEEVKEALDLCLACKGCKSECPVSVDMATYKAEFLAHYYHRNRRPRHAYAFGWIDRWARFGSQVPWLVNLVASTPGLRQLAKHAAGMTPNREIPRFARHTFKDQFRTRRPSFRVHGTKQVILWADTFNNYFYPGTLMAMADVLEHAGFHPLVPRPHLCCGRALYDYGMLDTAIRYWKRILHVLRTPIRAGIPVVGAEPSCVAAFRDELPNLLPDDEDAARLCEQTYTLDEFLTQRADGYRPPPLRKRAVLHGHCHHKSVLDFDGESKLLAQMGCEVEAPDTGCCGMAGSFGFEAGKYDVSMAVGERVLLPAVRAAADDTLIVADGFSCRTQITGGSSRKPMHLAEVIQRAIHDPSY